MDANPARDTSSPQTELVARGVAWLMERVARSAAGDTATWQRELVAAVRELAHGQPAMAAFFTLGTRALQVAAAADRDAAAVAERAARVREALVAWGTDWSAASARLVLEAQACLPASGWVATYTRSSLVERALLAAHGEGRPVRVLLAESRPALEGRALAATLARAGIPLWLAVDGSLGLLLPQAGAFWIGVDAVRERTFVTKAGTYALLLVARELNLPVYAFAQRAKFLPDRCRRMHLPHRSAAEVWEEAPPGVNVVNLAFEEVPLSLVRGVVTEGGMLGPQEAGQAAAGAPVAPELSEPDPPA